MTTGNAFSRQHPSATNWTDDLIVFLILFWGCHSLYGFISESSVLDVSKIESPEIRYVWTTVYIVCIWRLFRLPRNLVRSMLDAWPVLVLSVLSLASVLWSIEPDLSLRRSFAAFGSTIVIIYLIQYLSLARLIELLFWAMLAAMVVAVAVLALDPMLGIHQDSLYPAFRGAFPHKNPFGRAMFLGALCTIAICYRRGVTPLSLLAFLAFTTLLVLSRSATALMMLAMTVAVAILFPVYFRASTPLALGAILLLGIVAIVVPLVAFGILDTNLVEFLGRDVTFSGRTQIWSTLWANLTGERFFIGFGHEAFWQGRGGAIDVFAGQGYFVPPHAHNGVLQLWMAFGVMGAFLGMTFVVTFAGSAFRASRLLPASEAFFVSAFFVSFVIVNIFEAQIFNSNYLFWLIAGAIYVKTKRVGREIPANNVFRHETKIEVATRRA